MLVPERKLVSYDPARFIDIETVEEAAHIIVTPTEGMTAKHRWDNETPGLMRSISDYIMPESHVLDYGCGIGRLAKPMIEMLKCRVVGIDISPNMRALAASCVNSPHFFALDPAMFDMLKLDNFDAVVSVWALQHCIDLKEVLDRIRGALMTEGMMFVANNHTRCLPVEGGEWADDGLDINEMILDNGFAAITGKQKLDEKIAPGWMQDGTFWAVYQRR